MNKIYLILCAWIVVFTGCGPSYTELNGSIFLVSKDGISYKLGLTSVAALRKEEFKSLESSCIEMQNDFIAQETPVYDEARAEVLRGIERLDPLLAEYATAKSALESMIDSYCLGGSNFIPGVTVNVASNTVKEYVRGNGASARKIRAKINVEIYKLNEIVEKYQIIRSQVDISKQAMDMIALKAKERAIAYPRFLAETAFGVAQTKTKTDADGQFNLTLARGMDFVIIAYTDRSVGNSSENYNWFIPHTTKLENGKSSLLIANDNLNKYENLKGTGLDYFISSPKVENLYPEEMLELDLLKTID